MNILDKQNFEEMAEECRKLKSSLVKKKELIRQHNEHIEQINKEVINICLDIFLLDLIVKRSKYGIDNTIENLDPIQKIFDDIKMIDTTRDAVNTIEPVAIKKRRIVKKL